MDTYTVRITRELINRVGEELPELVTKRLTALEYDVTSVSIRDNPPALVVDADRDPTTDLEGWVPGPTPRELARAALRNALNDMRNTPQAQRTPADRAWLAWAVIQRLE